MGKAINEGLKDDLYRNQGNGVKSEKTRLASQVYLALPALVWVMSSPSGRGTPLRAGSPRCCNDRRPGSGSPHPPRRGGSPIRPSLLHPLHLEEQRVPEAWTVGPRSGRRCAHQRGSPAMSRHPRPDGLVRVSPLRSRLEGWARRAVAIAELMTGVAWLIPYCARPASTPSTPARNDQSCVRDARAREAAWPPYACSCVRDARARGISLAARLSALGVLPSGWV